VSSVDFNYPSCVGTQCDFNQASCTWTAVNGATNYDVKITQVESGSVTATSTVTAPAVTYSFPVENGKTYRCDVTATNTCGSAAQAGSGQGYCAVDGQVGSPQPTTPTVPPQVIPTVKAAGDLGTTVAIGIGGIVAVIAGGLLFFAVL
jgi:hypothetical protein